MAKTQAEICRVRRISLKNKYYIPEYRKRELRYFCLQYADWKHDVEVLKGNVLKGGSVVRLSYGGDRSDSVAEKAIRIAELEGYMKMVKDTCYEADSEIGNYIFVAVTQDLSYKNLCMMHGLPMCEQTYFERLHKFFYLLSKKR